MSGELELEINDGSGIWARIERSRRNDSRHTLDECNKDWVSKESLLVYLDSLRDSTGIKYSHTNSVINRFKIKLGGDKNER